MLDQVRRDLQDRLDDVLAEADKLRRALAALGPGDGTEPSISYDSPAPSSHGRTAAARRPGRSTTPPTSTIFTQYGSSEISNGNGASGRTASGATKSAVLAALAGGQAMTASEVANVAGLGRASVSTTLSKLAKTGEVAKAARGYQIAR